MVDFHAGNFKNIYEKKGLLKMMLKFIFCKIKKNKKKKKKKTECWKLTVLLKGVEGVK